MSKTTIPTGGITADAIDGTLIADDAINSEHYTDGSIDTAHFADSLVTSAKVSGVGGIHTQVGYTTISAAQNINVDGVFSSTYKNYFIIIEGWSHQNSTSQIYWTYRTGTSGSYASVGNTQGGVAAGRLRVQGSDPSFMGNDADGDQSVRLTTDVYNNEYSSMHLYCFNPYVTSRRSTISGRAPYREGSTSRAGFTDFGFISIGSEQHTGFKIYTQGSFNSGGTVTVYGITDGS